MLGVAPPSPNVQEGQGLGCSRLKGQSGTRVQVIDGPGLRIQIICGSGV